MRLPTPFVRLPLRFDAKRLQSEVARFGEDEWRAHPQRFHGNSSLALVSPGGEDTDAFTGPMRPTPRLAQAPYIRQVMAAFDTVVGRSRLMRLAPGASVDVHTDVHYFWRNHLRIHIPVLTTPDVTFRCGDEQVHMAEGDAWTFDNWRRHSVQNPSDRDRIHLVIDTVGSTALWRLIASAGNGSSFISYDAENDARLRMENFAGLPVMPVAELEKDLRQLVDDIAAPTPAEQQLKVDLDAHTTDLVRDWQSLWIEYGPTPDGFPRFRRRLAAYRQLIDRLPGALTLNSNDAPFASAVRHTLDAVLAPERFVAPAPGKPASAYRPDFDRPVFIVAAPRSGSTLLFETLAASEDFWSVGDEAHRQFESIPSLRPNRANQSNRLVAAHATPDVLARLRDNLATDLVDSNGRPAIGLSLAERPETIRFLEKTPKNALRIPFLVAAFPDARFIFLWRDARASISSLLDSWRSRRYVTYPRLPGWPASQPWSHLLVPGWQQFIGRPLAEIVAYQWVVTNKSILDDLGGLPRDRWCATSYDALLSDTPREIERLCEFSGVSFGPRLAALAAAPLKPSKYTLSAPDPDKWRKNAAELEPVLPVTGAITDVLRGLQ